MASPGWTFLSSPKNKEVEDESYIRERQEIVVPFLKNALASKHPHEDYEELLTLSLLYLGGIERLFMSVRALEPFTKTAGWQKQYIA
jgi:hypothetical protein